MNKRIIILVAIATFLIGINTVDANIIGDINGDGQVGLEEALFALQVAAGQHPNFPDTCVLTGVGIWDTGQDYLECDTVSHADNFYVALVSHTSDDNNVPGQDESTWAVLPLKVDPDVTSLAERIFYLEARLNDSDLDSDGYTPNQNDCDDTNPSIHPDAEEIIGDNIDNNCDGAVDTCIEGQTRPCGDTDVGACAFGTQTCPGGEWSIDCVGEIGPTEEICNGIDDDCDGDVDEGSPVCDDGNLCTENDTCSSGGTCLGTPIDCSLLADQCTSGSCDPQTGSCTYADLTGSPCDDGEDCTLNDTCSAGTCQGTWDEISCGCISDSSCDDGNICTTDSCDVNTYNCVYDVNTGTPCDDGMLTTHSDLCNESGVCEGTVYTCSPGLSCMNSVPDGLGGCIETVLPGFCVVNDICEVCPD